MCTVSIDAFSDNVQSKLIEQDLRIRPWPSAKRMWERSFRDTDRNRLGGSFADAYSRRGTIGMWMEVHGVSPIRALIDLSRSINLLGPEDHRWLSRETGEADGNGLMQSAILSGAIVLTDDRLSYFGGEPIQVDWEGHHRSWNFLWELAGASKRGRNLDHFDLGENLSPKTVRDRKHRLKALLPAELFRLIRQIRGSGCRIDLPADSIRLFSHDSSDLLVEWTGWEPADGF